MHNDRTGLSTYEIVQKVRCEAQESVQALFHRLGFHLKKAGEAELARKAEAQSDAQTAVDKELVRLKGVKDGLDLDAEDIAMLRRELVLAKERIDELEAAKDPAKNAREINRNYEVIKEKLPKLTALAESYPGRLRTYERDNLDFRKKKHEAAGQLADINRLKNKDFKDIIQFYGTGLVYNLRFKITENNDAVASGSLVWPISVGSITLGYDVGEKRERSAEREIKLVTSFGDLLNKTKCADDNPGEVRRYPIAGRVGLEEVISQYWKVQQDSKFKVAGESYTDTLLFTTTDNGSINPQWNLTPLPGGLRTVSGEATLGAKRTDIHELIVFLFPLVPDKAIPPTRVEIVNAEQAPTINVKIEGDRVAADATPASGKGAQP